MNILETFYILFRSDADKARKETADAKREAEQLAATLDKAGEAHHRATTAAAAGASAQAAASAKAGVAATQSGRAAVEAGRATAAAANEAKTAIIGEANAHVLAWQAAKKAQDEADFAARRRVSTRTQLGLTRQGADIFVTGAMGMSPFMIATQQLPQVIDLFQEAKLQGLGFRDVMADTGRSVAGILPILGALAIPLTAIVAVFSLGGIAKGQVEFLTNLGKLAEKAGDSVENVDALTRSIRNNGGTAEEAQKQIAGFAGKVKDAFADAKSEAAKAFASIGVSATGADGGVKATSLALAEVAGALENVSKKKAAATLDKLGISDPATVRLIMQGRAAVEARMAAEKALGVTTTEQVERAKKYQQEVAKLGDTFTDFRNIIAGAVLPALTRTVTFFRTLFEWIGQNRVLVGAFAGAAIAAIVAVSAVMWGSYIPAMVAAAAATVVAFAPFFLIAAAVVAALAVFAAIFEDINAYLNGQPSLLGVLAERYAGVRKAIEFVGAAFKMLADVSGWTWDRIKEGASIVGRWIEGVFTALGPPVAAFFRGVWDVAGPIFALIRDVVIALAPVVIAAFRLGFGVAIAILKEMWGQASAVFNFMMAAWRIIGNVLAAVAKFVGPIWTDMFEGWLRQVYLLINGVRRLFGLKPDPAVASALNGRLDLSRGRAQLGAAARTPLAAQTPASVRDRAGAGAAGNRTNTVKIDKVEVRTNATDADGIARGIGGALNQHVRQATSAFDNGVDR